MLNIQSLNLKKKIMIVAGIPFALYLTLSLWSIVDSWNTNSLYRSNQQAMNLVTSVSEAVHELQKERGKSATYLNGGLEFSEVSAQRQHSDERIASLGKILSITSENILAQEALAGLKSLRSTIDKKEITAKEAIGRYSNLIETTLSLDRIASEKADAVGMGSRFRSIAILESAKENAGKLRANISSVLASNAPLSQEQFDIVTRLMAGVESNLRSEGLNVSSQTTNEIQAFLVASHWIQVREVFQWVLKNSEKGQYQKDSKEFFKTITLSIEELAKILFAEIRITQEHLKVQAQRSLWSLGSMALVLVFMAFGLVWVLNAIVKAITLPIQDAIVNLEKSSLSVTGSSEQLERTSEQLSSATTEAAASLQETVSTIDEINAMVQKNADNSLKAQDRSQRSLDRVKHGQQVVARMVQAIREIDTTNNRISNEVGEGNQKIQEIVKLINQIGEKTQVIHDIVFQTKLLSFNASVEAARAGEHGKGFAVVAEEVGKLALMSGKAAAEIANMLNESTKQVEDIIHSTTTSVEQSFQDSKSKVQHGVSIAGECDKALADALLEVNETSRMVEEITIASKEQSVGVQEINKAMSQMDEVTQQNATSTSKSAESAKELSVQAANLKEVIQLLVRAITGNIHRT